MYPVIFLNGRNKIVVGGEIVGPWFRKMDRSALHPCFSTCSEQGLHESRLGLDLHISLYLCSILPIPTVGHKRGPTKRVEIT